MDRGAWRATVPGVAKSQTRLRTAQHIVNLRGTLKVFPDVGSNTHVSRPKQSNCTIESCDVTQTVSALANDRNSL